MGIDDECPWDDCIYPLCNVNMGCPPSAFETKEYKEWKEWEDALRKKQVKPLDPQK
jgi:hypothetical protein